MGAESSATPLLPGPEVVHICIIDADRQFSDQLGRLLADEMPGMVNIVGTYDEIPQPLAVPYAVSLVIFDPELDDFHELPKALSRMWKAFGNDALLAVHADSWKNDKSMLKHELQLFGVQIGFTRFNLNKCFKLVAKVAMREPLAAWVSEFNI